MNRRRPQNWIDSKQPSAEKREPVTLSKPPTSATHGWVAFAALAGFLAAMGCLRVFRPFGDQVVSSALFLIGVTAAFIFATDLLWQKVYLRSSTGLNFKQSNPSLRRSLTKYAGLLGSLGFVGFLYWLLPEYHSAFYTRYYQMLLIVLPPWLVLAIPYLYWIDKHMPQPKDGYWHMGQAVCLNWQEVDRAVLGQHVLGWLIKGFFFPLMFTYMCNDIAKFVNYDFGKLSHFGTWFDLIYDFLYFVDVGIVSMGYLISMRVTDTHLRSAEPTLLGWSVALLCYQPFWSLAGRNYLAYDTDLKWGAWLWNQPLIYGIWGTSILLLTAVYVWATVIFGGRFSNLTHRGIITNGPYRYTKHPAYIAKNLSWWMISVPFVLQSTASEAIRHCLLLLALNGVYWMRAITEERHLSWDPDYVAYSDWIKSHGVFRFTKPK